MSLGVACLSLLSALLFEHVDAGAPEAYRFDYDSGKHGSYPARAFISSKVQVPFLNFLKWNAECDDGQYYFITPRGWKIKEPGPMILDGVGNLIWAKHFDNEYGGQAYDLKVQKYEGQDYLTFWLGDDTIRGHGSGHYYMLNSSYDIVHEIGAANGLQADLHDFIVTPEGTALLVIFKPVKADVRPVGRKFSDMWNQAIWDAIIQEVNIKTGDLIFEWRASQHLDLSKTYFKLASKMGDHGTSTNPFDPFHINSVDKDQLGNYLISLRNLHAILYIDGKSKEVLWTLGGNTNNFQDHSSGHALNFAWQHDARFVELDAFPESYNPPASTIGRSMRLMTLFDNAAMDWDYSYGPPYSRGLLLELTYPTSPDSEGQAAPPLIVASSSSAGSYKSEWQHTLSPRDLDKIKAINGTNASYTVRVVHEYTNSKRVISSTQGSAQMLPRGSGKDPKVLVGYGINAVLTEFSADGNTLCDAHFAPVKTWEKGDVQSYRTFKFPWRGQPTQKPAAKLHKKKIWVSWNGDTECVEWVVQKSYDPEADAQQWGEIARTPRVGFETSIALPSSKDEKEQPYYRAVAICPDMNVCPHGVSEVIEHSTTFEATAGKIKDISGEPWAMYFAVLATVFGLLCLVWYLRFSRKRRPKNFRSTLPRQRMD